VRDTAGAASTDTGREPAEGASSGAAGARASASASGQAAAGLPGAPTALPADAEHDEAAAAAGWADSERSDGDAEWDAGTGAGSQVSLGRPDSYESGSETSESEGGWVDEEPPPLPDLPPLPHLPPATPGHGEPGPKPGGGPSVLPAPAGGGDAEGRGPAAADAAGVSREAWLAAACAAVRALDAAAVAELAAAAGLGEYCQQLAARGTDGAALAAALSACGGDGGEECGAAALEAATGIPNKYHRKKLLRRLLDLR
jgi:hypothetical protein